MNSRFVKSLSSVAPYFIIAILIVLREPTLFSRPEFHAEDCTEFFATAYSKGFYSLFTPIWGYHFLLGRIIAYGASFSPVLWIPSIYMFSSLFFNTITLAYFSRDGFSWLIKSRNFRILTCILMATGPGNEVYVGLCVMYSPLILFGLMLLLEQPWNLSWQRILIILFLTFSTGAMFSLIPIIILLMYFTKDKKYSIVLLIIVGVSIYITIGTTSSDSLTVQKGLLTGSNIFYAPEIVFKNFITRLFITPFFGLLSMDLIRNPVKFARAVLVCGIFIYIFIKQGLYKDRNIFILLLIYSSFIGILGITAIVRNYGMDILLMKYSISWEIRYFFLPGMAAILFWSYIIFHQTDEKNILISIMFVYILISINLLSWKFGLKRENLNWKAHSINIQKAIDERDAGTLEKSVTIDFPVHPKWTCSVEINPKK